VGGVLVLIGTTDGALRSINQVIRRPIFREQAPDFKFAKNTWQQPLLSYPSVITAERVSWPAPPTTELLFGQAEACRVSYCSPAASSKIQDHFVQYLIYLQLQTRANRFSKINAKKPLF